MALLVPKIKTFRTIILIIKQISFYCTICCHLIVSLFFISMFKTFVKKELNKSFPVLCKG